MDFFDKLLSAHPPIVRPNGHLVKRMPEELDDIQVRSMAGPAAQWQQARPGRA